MAGVLQGVSHFLGSEGLKEASKMKERSFQVPTQSRRGKVVPDTKGSGDSSA